MHCKTIGEIEHNKESLMSEEKKMINLDKKQFFELKQIIFDKDEEVAFKFLENHIYKHIKKHKKSHFESPF